MPALIRFKNWLWLGSRPSRQINPWRRGIDHFRNVEARIMGIDQGSVVGGPARLGLRSPGRNIDRQRGVADLNALAGFEPDFAHALDRLPVDFRPIGAAEVFDPVITPSS